jgi:ABC-type dipeptide/oligopeptide/nickel transport system permease component
MRLVLRRLLWLGPTLLAITLLTFAVLSSALPAEPELEDLPLFFNPEPGSVERLSRRALAQVAALDPAALEAERTLTELGGAALPFVLPALDAQSPEERARVVRALRAVGTRMGLEFDPNWEPSREVLFWTRFWEEHSIDYRPSVAKRAVSRLGQRSTLLRDTEVRQLDTYALEELVAQMPPQGALDLERVRRLAQIAASITGEIQLQISPSADLLQAERVAAAWQDWWSRHRSRYKIYSGTERIAAMLRDTRYGGWVAQAVRRKLGLVHGGRAAWDVLVHGARVTLPLFFAGVLGAWAGAVASGVFTSRRALMFSSAVALLRALLPVLVLAVLVSRWLGSATGQLWVGALLMALVGAPLSIPDRAQGPEARTAGFLRTLAALGVRPWRAGLTTVRLSSARLAVQLGAHLSNLLTLACVVEYVLGLPGLGAETIAALQHPDLNWLMAITVSAVLFAGLWHVFGEWLVSLLDPRWASASNGAEGEA